MLAESQNLLGHKQMTVFFTAIVVARGSVFVSAPGALIPRRWCEEVQLMPAHTMGYITEAQSLTITEEPRIALQKNPNIFFS